MLAALQSFLLQTLNPISVCSGVSPRHEESTPHPEEQPLEVTMRPKGPHSPYQRHARTHRDHIQGIFGKREQRAKAQREPKRSK
jgi:hypothetical protein